MRIGVLITSISNFGEKGFYNVQEVGLAKALDKLADEVIVCKLIPQDQPYAVEQLANCDHVTMKQIPARNFGINGFLNTKELDPTLDALIYFSDTQFALPKVARWAKKNGVALYPYIGVIESHAESTVKRLLINTLFRRNLAVYKRKHCFVKTPHVAARLAARGVKHTTVTPVGLDRALLQINYADADIASLKNKYGYEKDDRVLLFIGRFAEEKHPERMIDILAKVRERDTSYRLLMVGKGELHEATEQRAREMGLDDAVKFIDRIPNSDIWELYRIADAFVNLSEQEIFGMAILEAMYYGCHVVAFHAPGPDYIIEDGINGDLADSAEAAVEKLLMATDYAAAAHTRIAEHFTWESVAEKMVEIIKQEREQA